MKTIILITNNEKLKKLFNDYDCSVKESFDVLNNNRVESIRKTNRLVKEIENSIKDSKNEIIEIFDEEFYDENIQSTVAKNLLMNGLYYSKDLNELINKYSKEISKEFHKKLKKLIKKVPKKDFYVLFWNTSKEVANAILSNI